MFEYKEVQYYTDFFGKLDDFNLVQPFTENKEKRCYIGEIEALQSVHPIIIRVEIPFTFPHHKLMFYTSSLKGYPHLIPCKDDSNDHWFCLNTPFAETAEEQLNQELNRLREWKHKFMHQELPANIEDIDVRRALHKIGAYSWENFDELAEYRHDTNMIFVGNLPTQTSEFKEKQGYFNCIRGNNNNFYLFEKWNKFANEKIPYILVDEMPEDESDFVSLVNQFNWNKETCDFLLPKFDSYPKEYKVNNSLCHPHSILELESKEKGIPLDDRSRLCFSCNNPGYTEEQANHFLRLGINSIVIPNHLKELIDNEIETIEKRITENHGIKGYTYQPFRLKDETVKDFNNRISIEEEGREYSQFVYPYILNYFLLGIKSNGQIQWKTFGTNRDVAHYTTAKFDVWLCDIEIKKIESWDIFSKPIKAITYEQYFGRGAFEKDLCEKKVAIIGLGALGSQVALSLVRSGVKIFGLWDNDLIEPGNICRSTYNIQDLGNSKVQALFNQLKTVNPYIKVTPHGKWNENGNTRFPREYINGDLYSNINYKSQTDVLKELEDYDLIIDCTASNELLHYLSYAVQDKTLISLCITNHANQLLLLSNKDGNVYDLRKAYLSKIEQDTKNFYAEGTGCYSPTFLALNCDIAALVNLAVKEMNDTIGKGKPLQSVTWSYCQRGIVADRLLTYQLADSDIQLHISSEVKMDAEEMDDVNDNAIGFLLGTYSSDGKTIMVTHCVDSSCANQLLADAYATSNGIIDYIGDYCYATDEEGHYAACLLEELSHKAHNENINTNNPILLVRTPKGHLKFYLYINNSLIPFHKLA